MNDNELPKDIGGYQSLVLGPTQKGDIWVSCGIPDSFVTISIFPDVAKANDIMVGWSIYRKIPTPHNHCDGIRREILPDTDQAQVDRHGNMVSNNTFDDKTFIPQDDILRKRSPMFRGLLGYFPAALFEVANHSYESDEKHNPGNVGGPTWARSKSSDHPDCILRHLVDAGTRGTPNRRYHLKAAAWRALALLQEDCEADGALPGVSSR